MVEWNRNHTWTGARFAALTRDGYTCRCCGRGRLPVLILRLLLGQAWQQRMPLVEWWVLTEWEWFAYRATMEVHHLQAVRGRHGQNGCHHHLDPAVARQHELRVQVDEHGAYRGAVLVKHPESGVAPGAEDPPDSASDVVVVYIRSDLGEAAFADGTRVPLTIEKGSVLLGTEPVEPPQAACLGSAPVGAVDGVTSSDPLSAAKDAADRLLRGAPPVPGLTSLGAVQPTRVAVEQGRALQTPIHDGSSVEGAGATEPGVMALAESGALSLHGSTALGNAALVHARIVPSVPAEEMPPPKGGLVTLCHECHVLETRAQRQRGDL